jgi:hypothetical protein
MRFSEVEGRIISVNKDLNFLRKYFGLELPVLIENKLDCEWLVKEDKLSPDMPVKRVYWRQGCLMKETYIREVEKDGIVIVSAGCVHEGYSYFAFRAKNRRPNIGTDANFGIRADKDGNSYTLGDKYNNILDKVSELQSRSANLQNSYGQTGG